MCGISGLFLKHGDGGTVVDEVLAMNRRIAHRGPDGEGLAMISSSGVSPLFTNDTPTDHRHRDWKYSPKVSAEESDSSGVFGALAHRRLSILDLSAKGHQPMCNEEGRYWLTFNGEIYNYKGLRLELEQAGFVFHSRTDTEVVLKGFIHWRSALLQKLDGMFAFAIYDRETGKLFCARDRTGVKPFLYTDNRFYFAFASEEKAFFGLSGFSASVRAEAVFDFFVQGKFGHETQGFFSSIQELDAGHYLEYDVHKGHFSIQAYRLPEESQSLAHENPVEAFRELFFQSVQNHLQSDVEVGACLSGGLDSSSIVAAMRHFQGFEKRIPLFTAVFPGHSFDESEYAASVSEKFGGDSHFIYPEADGLARSLDDLIYSQDIPLWSTSTYAQHSVMAGVRKAGIKVVLDGQGGDELLGGYHHHYYSFWRELFFQGRWRSLIREFKHARFYLPLGPYVIRTFLQQDVLPRVSPILVAQLMRQYYRDMNWLNPAFVNEHRLRLDQMQAVSDLRRFLDAEIYGWRLKGYLKCEDRASMWHSVESRTPFADDRRLIGFSRSLGSEWKIRNGASKYILRKSMEGILPEKILERKDKIGYATPNKTWLKAILPQALDEIRHGGAEFFNLPQIEKDFSGVLKSENPHDTRIFKFVGFGVWRRIFSV
jgi:asparagine synthase (glutamine-hydrolysing)